MPRYRCIHTSLLLLLTMLACLPAWAAPPAPNPGAVAEVLSGKRTEANAAWWGFDATDSTAILQAAIASGARTLIIPNMGKEWITGPLELAANQEIRFELGVVVTAKRGAFRGKIECLFRAANKANITLRGYGATLRMWKSDYQSADYEKSEWRHILYFRSCSNVQVLGLTLRESGGDGIYLGSAGGEQPYCRDVLIKDVVCDANHRQGMSIIGARNLLVEGCTFKDTRGTAPEAGVDLEPNGPHEPLANCVFRDCTFEKNAGAGFALYAANMRAGGGEITVRVENCRVRGSDSYGLGVMALRDGGPRGLIEFVDCTVEDTRGAGALVRGKSADTARVRFTRCRFNRVAAGQGGTPPLVLAFSKRDGVRRLGGVEFRECVLDDGRFRPFLSVAERFPEGVVTDITGTVAVRNPYGVAMALDPGEGITLKARPLPATKPALPALRPLHPGAKPTADLPPVRRTATYLLHANRREMVTLTVVCRQVGKYANALRFAVLAPSGQKVAEGEVAPGTEQAVGFVAPEEGIYALAAAPDGNAMEVRGNGRLALLADAGLDLLMPEGRLFFWVPAGTREFVLEVAGEGTAEQVRAAILDGEGRVVQEQDGITGAKPYRFQVRREASAPGEAWSIRFARPTAGAYEDVHLRRVEGVSPVLSPSMEGLLIPR